MNFTYDYIIIGAGFSGMCAAIKLKQAGYNNIIILERNKQLGGTWYDNAYPGAACDIQSHLYSFSFEPKPDWSRMFSPQQEILSYMEHCAQKYGLNPLFKFNTTINGATFNNNKATWDVYDTEGNTYTAPVVISCSGGLSQPALPDIKGLASFKGNMFHSAKWDRTYDLKGKTVAVIGTGASAIQIVPAIAPDVKHLYLYQRTPPWIIPKPDREMGSFEKKLFKALPFTQSILRGWLYWVHELTAGPFLSNGSMMRIGERLSLRHLKKSISNEALRKKLTPNYNMGCKRVLLSNDYYPALQRSNVSLVTEPVKEITPAGVLTVDGIEHAVDTIVLATGFHAADGVLAFDIKGRNGIELKDAWKDGAQAYLGTTVSGFPNLYFVVGPNTGLGHSSMILMIEAQVGYIVQAIATQKQNAAKYIDLKKDAETAYNNEIQLKLAETVWQKGGCVSWYQNKNGKNVTLWPGYTFTFINRTKRFDAGKYEMVR